MKEKMEVEVKGRDLISGLPKVIEISSVEVREAIIGVLEKISEAIKEAVEKSPPEIIADLIDKGIILAGGGALIYGLDQFLEKRLKLPIVVLDDPLLMVARGTEILLDEIELLEKVKVIHDDVM